MTQPDRRVEQKQLEEVQDRLKILQATPAAEKAGRDPWCHQDEILGILATVTGTLSDAAQARSTEYGRMAERLSGIERDVKHIQSDIASLCKVVRDGNGQPSLMQRLANLEVVVANNKGDITEVKGHANSIIAAKALSKSQVVAGLVGIIVTVLLSTFALIATLLK